MKMRKKTKQPNYSKRDNDLFGDLTITLSFLILLGVIVSMALSFSGCTEKVKTQKKIIPLTESQIEFKESQVCIDTNSTYFSIDNHQLVQYKNDAIMHLSSCKECLKRHGF